MQCVEWCCYISRCLLVCMKKDRPNSDLFQKCGGTKYAILRLAKFQLTNPRFKANGSLFSRYFAVFNHFSHQIHVEKVFYVTCLCTCRLCKCVLCMSVSVQIDAAAAFLFYLKLLLCCWSLSLPLSGSLILSLTHRARASAKSFEK